MRMVGRLIRKMGFKNSSLIKRVKRNVVLPVIVMICGEHKIGAKLKYVF